MYVLHGIHVVTMGYSIDSLDVCFGDQFAGPVTLGIPKLRIFPVHILLIPISHSKLENLNHSKLNGTS